MFDRFHQTPSRLQVSLRESRRIGGKPRCEHVASLGSVPIPTTIADRIAFWGLAGDRLERLSNRIGNEKGKIVSAIHARIPVFDGEDIRSVQRENAEADEKFWSGFQDMNAEIATGKRELAKAVTQEADAAEAQAKDAAAKASIAKDRIERLAMGEDVKGGLDRPLTLEVYEKILKDNGWSNADIRRSKQTHLISELGAFEELLNEINVAHARAEKSAHRKVLKKTVVRALRDGRIR